jgi:hypothetical protein
MSQPRLALLILRWKIKSRHTLLDVSARFHRDLLVISSRSLQLWEWKFIGSVSSILYGLGVAVMQLIGAFQAARILFALAICLLSFKLFISGTKGTSWITKIVVLMLVSSVGGGLTQLSFKWVRKAEDTQIAKDTQTARQEFLLHRSDLIKDGIHFQVRLNRLYYPEELGSYKVSVQLVSRDGAVWINSYFPAKGHIFYKGSEQKNISQNVVWMLRGNDYSVLQDTALGWFHTNTYRLEAYFAPRPNTLLQTMGDFDGEQINVWVNRELISKIVYISVWADEYLFLGLPMRCIDTTDVYKPVWPDPILGDVREEWSKEHWTQLVPHGFRANGPAPPVFNFPLSFEDYTPPTTRKFESLKDGLDVSVPDSSFCRPQP